MSGCPHDDDAPLIISRNDPTLGLANEYIDCHWWITAVENTRRGRIQWKVPLRASSSRRTFKRRRFTFTQIMGHAAIPSVYTLCMFRRQMPLLAPYLNDASRKHVLLVCIYVDD